MLDSEIYFFETETSRFLNLTQGTEKWLRWRKGGVAASDVAAVLGVSPYMTPYKLWLNKTGRVNDFVTNHAIERGKELEPAARAHFEFLHGLDMPDICAELIANPIFKASLDGYNRDHEAILEIKCPQEANHQLNLSGVIQDYYECQLEHQLLCTGAKLVYFVSYYKSKDSSTASVKVIEYRSKPELRDRILDEVPRFWKFVELDTPPPLSSKDTQVLPEDNEMFQALATLHDDYKNAECAYNTLKDEIISRLTHTKVQCGRVSITKSGSSYRVSIAKESK
jgi:putative phage-type endonuclease